MATYWYVDANDSRQGPFSEEQFIRLVQDKTVSDSFHVWTDGMSAWAVLKDAAGLRSFLCSLPASATETKAIADGTSGRLVFTGTTWGLFWRFLLAYFSPIFIIPAPWAYVAKYRYIVQNIGLPSQNRRFSFHGNVASSWYLSVGQGLLIWIPLFKIEDLTYLSKAVAIALIYSLSRWLYRSVALEASERRFCFNVSFLSYLGFAFLVVVSALSLIGWAWIVAWFYRWIVRNIEGELEFEFHGSGLAILWRYCVAAVCCCLVLPIPWVVKWMYSWHIGQISARPRAADAAKT